MVLTLCQPRNPFLSQGLEMLPAHNTVGHWSKAIKDIRFSFSGHLLPTTLLPRFPGGTRTQLTQSGCWSGQDKPQHCSYHARTDPTDPALPAVLLWAMVGSLFQHNLGVTLSLLSWPVNPNCISHKSVRTSGLTSRTSYKEWQLHSFMHNI